ncbi:MAG: hypothetical protein ACYCQI_07190 [Gammaproteobacteria bacterium]
MHAREYFYSKERLIHTLDSGKIFHILHSSAWKTLDQEITSAETNNDRNVEPDMKSIQLGENTCGVDAFADLTFDKTVKRILDVGGGKYDYCHDHMKSRNIDLLVWDPYNRPKEHNLDIQKSVTNKKVDAATSMAVLNVIPEPEVRLAHICTLKEALVVNGVAYFKVWPGEGALKGSYKPTVNSYGHPGYQANAHADRFLREVQIVFGLNNAKLHETIPNLIVAIKKSDEPTSKAEIELIQKLSTKDSWYFKRKDWLFKNHCFFKADCGKSKLNGKKSERILCKL